jgi:cytochrome P450
MYEGSLTTSGHANTFNCRDRGLHARKRRLLAPAFTDAALASMEEYMLKHINLLMSSMSVGSASRLEKEEAAAATELDMATWANYLTFDIMGDLVFGEDLGLLEGRGSRELPQVIDAAVHYQLMASSLQTITSTTSGKLALTYAYPIARLQRFSTPVAP